MKVVRTIASVPGGYPTYRCPALAMMPMVYVPVAPPSGMTNSPSIVPNSLAVASVRESSRYFESVTTMVKVSSGPGSEYVASWSRRTTAL